MFHAQYMLALGHYERATNELTKAIAMMENNDYKSAYLHSNASAAQGLRTISAIDLQILPPVPRNRSAPDRETLFLNFLPACVLS